MHVSLPPELEQFVAEKVKAGQYASPDQVVEESLRLLRDLPVWTDDDLRKELEIGLEQLDRGEGKPWNVDEIKAEVISRHAARQSAE